MIPNLRRFHMPQSNQACAPQVLSPHATTTEAPSPSSPCSASAMTSPSTPTAEEPQLTPTGEKPEQQQRPVVVELPSHIQYFANPQTVASQALYPWRFPGKTTGVGCHFLLQGIFQTQGSNPCLLHWQADSLSSEPPRKPQQRPSIVKNK